MPVSKRTRFEVLRRDEYTCRYCRSTENQLTVDHVTPVSLGGSDSPDNLVACCKDCNSGKASSSPDSATVAQVADDALRWAAAMKRAAQERARKRDADMAVLGKFYDYWNEVTAKADLPSDWEVSVTKFLAAGLSMGDLEDAALTSVARLSPWARHHFRYFCGICWNEVREISDRAKELLDSEEPPSAE